MALSTLAGCAATAGGDAADAPGASVVGVLADRTGAGLPTSSAALQVEDPDALDDNALNLVLSEGYAQLYATATGLKFIDEALLVKFESDELAALAERISSDMVEMERQMEQLAQDYPSLSIEHDGLPLLETRKRAAAQKDRLASLAPLTGLSGKPFERTLLLTLSGAFNQTVYLARVMQEFEKSDERLALLAGIERTVQQLYDADVALLERQHFRP